MTAAVYLMLAGAALAAPAPATKPPPPPPALVPQVCVMTWRGIDAETTFHDGGFYACQWRGAWWNGTWRQEAGTLHVEEWPLDNPDARMKWKVKLSGPTAGDMDGSPWKVRPWAGRID